MSDYASAKLMVDSHAETTREKFEYQDIAAEREDEQKKIKRNAWLGTLVGSLFGPIGMVVGGMLGRYATDYFYDSEDNFISLGGKFNDAEIALANEEFRQFDKDMDEAMLWDTATDVLMAWGMSGADDWTSFGSGDDAMKGWAVGGKADAAAQGKGFFEYHLKNPTFYKSMANYAGGVPGIVGKVAANTVLVDNLLQNEEEACAELGGNWDPGTGCDM